MSYSPPSTIKPFTLSVSDQDLLDFIQLLRLSKLGPHTYENQQPGNEFGVTYEWLSSAKDFWLNKFDWRAQEKYINSFPNYTTEIEGLTVHFVGLFSQKKDAIPIIFIHGWPGSFLEFLPLLEVVKKQYEGKELPYHIVVPSLPGYTLSSGPPLDKSWTVQDSTRVLDTLMQNLGFSKYLAQGGDVGSIVAVTMALAHDACVGIHINMIIPSAPPDPSTLTEKEKQYLQKGLEWRQTGMAYAITHSTKPSTIGHVISSNPLALLAWIGEKFLSWTDPATTPPLPTLLTSLSLYWFTSSFPRSIYPYRALFKSLNAEPLQTPYISKPLGFSRFAHEIAPPAKSTLEKQANLVHWADHDKGGHFAAWERPEQVWEDVEGFVGKAWK